ncbi:MAG: glycosyltransferase [Pseudomonadota bacterium]
MKISVIIAAYEKPEHLRKVLAGYDIQTDDFFEIVLAEDGMSPEVKEVADEFAAYSRVPITHVRHEDKGFRKTVILNKAIEKTSGEYLIFTDDDCIPKENLVSVHRRFSCEGQYIVGAYNRLPESTSLLITPEIVRNKKAFSLFWLMRNGYLPSRGFVRIVIPQWLAYLLDRRGELSYGRFPGGHSSCFKKDAVVIGGFNENMAYGLEDREFGTRLCNSNIKGKRVKNSTFMLHLYHDRPYQQMEEFAENQKILNETVETGRKISAHLDKCENIKHPAQ